MPLVGVSILHFWSSLLVVEVKVVNIPRELSFALHLGQVSLAFSSSTSSYSSISSSSSSTTSSWGLAAATRIRCHEAVFSRHFPFPIGIALVNPPRRSLDAEEKPEKLSSFRRLTVYLSVGSFILSFHPSFHLSSHPFFPSINPSINPSIYPFVDDNVKSRQSI